MIIYFGMLLAFRNSYTADELEDLLNLTVVRRSSAKHPVNAVKARENDANAAQAQAIPFALERVP